MEIEQLKSILEVISSFATIIGIPVAIFLYIDGKRKERIERASAVYDSLDQWYADFLRLSFENADLAAIYYGPLLGQKAQQQTLTEDQQLRQILYFEMLISILERAFLIYRNQPKSTRSKRWKGWDDYMKDWMLVPQFREYWALIGEQWDEDFAQHMNAIRKHVELKAKLEAGADSGKGVVGLSE